MLSMKLRIWKKKLMFLHHIKNLKDTDLAKMIWKEQLDQDWPGLVKEAKGICSELEIEDVNETSCSKNEWRNIVSKACKAKDKVEIMAEMEGKTKLEHLMQDGVEAKPSLHAKPLSQVREQFEIRTFMTKGFKANFKSKYSDLKCEACGSETDSQSHAMVCPEYADLRVSVDFTKDEDLVNYFRKVLERRDG